ncbi:unnamed protein product [Vicia faba]|uniref:Uncharacterized protein n=1 Tax=Vicia faba TaxID=3906 RepID=A0AAV0YZ99_VICFA|nr:unnamed protein product [Vicia faba]
MKPVFSSYNPDRHRQQRRLNFTSFDPTHSSLSSRCHGRFNSILLISTETEKHLPIRSAPMASSTVIDMKRYDIKVENKDDHDDEKCRRCPW